MTQGRLSVALAARFVSAFSCGGAPAQKDKAGGNGGGERAAHCEPNQYLAGLKYGFTRDGNQPKFLDYVEITCQPLQRTGNASTVCLGTNDNGCMGRKPPTL